MIPRTADYYDLIKYGFQNGGSYQEFVDEYLSKLQNGMKTAGFTWDNEIQMDFTYSQVQAELGLATLPTYVNIDSPGVFKSTDGFELSSGSIPRMKHGYSLNEKTIREEMIMAQRTNAFSTNLGMKMKDLLFDNTKKLIMGNYNGLTYQRDQMVSKGEFVLSTENNPSGLVGITFKANVPTANKTTLTSTARWFTDANNTEGSASDPIKDLKDKVIALKRKGVAAMHFEVDYLTFERSMNHSKIRQAIALNIYPLADNATLASIAATLDMETLRMKLSTIVGAPINIIDNIVSVEKYDLALGKVVKTQLRSFQEDVWVLVPDGALGTIKAVEPIAVPDPAARIAFFDGGRTLLKQWYNTQTNTQYIESELTTLVVPNMPQYMLYLTIA